MSRVRLIAAAFLLIVACGGADGVATTTTATSSSTTTSSTTTTTTTTSTTTTTTTSTTTTTTTTTTLPSPPVSGWEGDGPAEVALSFPKQEETVDDVVRRALRALGIEVATDTVVTLEVDLESTGYYVDYETHGRCFGGAAVDGSVSLIDGSGEHEALRADVEGEYPPPMFLFGSCDRPDVHDAPFDYAFEPGFVRVVVGWWGEAAARYLATVLRADHYVFDARIEAIQALRLMDWERIPADDQYEVLDAALWFAGRITHMSDDGSARTYRRAVEALFDEAIDWEIDIPVTDDALKDSFVITGFILSLEKRY